LRIDGPSNCGVTQPTLSAAVRELEAELDVLIVERGQRFRSLTAEGERVVEWARRILADRDALRQEVGSARQGLAGRLVLGVIPTALASIGLMISPFQQDHPRVRIKVLSLSSIEIQQGLDNFDLDAGISYLDNEPLLRVRTLPLYRERYFLVTSDRALFRRRDSVTWAEAADVPLCLLTADMQNRRIIDTVCHPPARAPPIFTALSAIYAAPTMSPASMARPAPAPRSASAGRQSYSPTKRARSCHSRANKSDCRSMPI
jgi:DNA-binding transcriptional LysR family regulator